MPIFADNPTNLPITETVSGNTPLYIIIYKHNRKNGDFDYEDDIKYLPYIYVVGNYVYYASYDCEALYNFLIKDTVDHSYGSKDFPDIHDRLDDLTDFFRGSSPVKHTCYFLTEGEAEDFINLTVREMGLNKDNFYIHDLHSLDGFKQPLTLVSVPFRFKQINKITGMGVNKEAFDQTGQNLSKQPNLINEIKSKYSEGFGN